MVIKIIGKNDQQKVDKRIMAGLSIEPDVDAVSEYLEMADYVIINTLAFYN